MTKLVNIRDGAPYDVYIGRAGHGLDGYFGNPFDHASRGANISAFKSWFLKKVDSDPEYRRRVLALKGKTLGCFCRPLLCHGDVIIAWLREHDE